MFIMVGSVVSPLLFFKFTSSFLTKFLNVLLYFYAKDKSPCSLSLPLVVKLLRRNVSKEMYLQKLKILEKYILSKYQSLKYLHEFYDYLHDEVRMQSYDPSKVPPARGLGNIGNTCYFNSLMQALLSCSALNDKIREIGNSNLLAMAYNRMYTGECTNVGELLRIIMHKRKVKKQVNTLHVNWQEDAHEGLMLMLEDLGDETDKQLYIRYKTKLSCVGCGNSKVVDDEHHEAPEIFIDYYDGHPLPVYLRNHQTTPDDYKCDKCGQIGTTKKIKMLCRLSNIICVTFKKYANKSNISFPMEFAIDGKSGPMIYKIVAQIEHMGGQGGGHYVARGLRNGQVFLFDDSMTSASKFEPTANTYMVFYHIFSS